MQVHKSKNALSEIHEFFTNHCFKKPERNAKLPKTEKVLTM